MAENSSFPLLKSTFLKFLLLGTTTLGLESLKSPCNLDHVISAFSLWCSRLNHEPNVYLACVSREFPKIRNGETKEVCFNAIITYSGPNPDRLPLFCYLSSANLANISALPCEFMISEQSSCTRLPLVRSVARALEWKSALLLSSSRIIEALNRGPFVEFERLVSPTLPV